MEEIIKRRLDVAKSKEALRWALINLIVFIFISLHICFGSVWEQFNYNLLGHILWSFEIILAFRFGMNAVYDMFLFSWPFFLMNPIEVTPEQKRFFGIKDNELGFKVRDQTTNNEPIRHQTTSMRRDSLQLEQMARRVKEVLPQVPSAVIERDLVITANVDETITRILDNTVRYQPEIISEKQSASKSLQNQAKSDNLTASSANHLQNEELPTLNTAAKSFGRTATERMKSYEERKNALLESARIRFIQKNGLQTTSSS